jgi:hypothetical protein
LLEIPAIDGTADIVGDLPDAALQFGALLDAGHHLRPAITIEALSQVRAPNQVKCASIHGYKITPWSIPGRLHLKTRSEELLLVRLHRLLAERVAGRFAL